MVFRVGGMLLSSAIGLLVVASAVLGAVTKLSPNATSSTPKQLEAHHSGIHVASWRWDEIGVFFTFTAFVLITGLAKVGK